MLPETSIFRYKIISCFLVFLLLFLPPTIYAGSFEEVLEQGKELGTKGLTDFNPQNINQTLQDLGIGTIEEIIPNIDEAQSSRSSYEGYYLNPGALSGAGVSDAGNFVINSYETRDKFDLSLDPLFGNRCLQQDSDGRCIIWSSSGDLLTNIYPDCEKVIIPEYGEVREETCSGSSLRQNFDCETRMVVSIVTEQIPQRCNQILVDTRPNQIYAVCRDYGSIYRVNKGQVWAFCGHYAYCKAAICSDGRCNFCFWNDCPIDSFVVNSESELPPGAVFLGSGVTDILVIGKSGRRIIIGNLYHYYVAYRPSVIERVLLSFDSTCGANFERFLNECLVYNYQKCNSSGLNCVDLIRDGEPTGQSASLECQNFASSIGFYQSQNCETICPSEYDECIKDCIGCDNCSSCEEAKTVCQGSCDETYSTCDSQCLSSMTSCLESCGEDQDCKDSCQSEFVDCQLACSQDKSTCYENCEGDFQGCINCTPQCQSYCQRNCVPVTISNYEICTLPDSSQGLRVNGTIVTETPYRYYFTTREGYVDIHWQTVFGGPGVREKLNDWWSKVRFVCDGDSDSCKILEDQGCVLYSQRCIDENCNQYEFVYRCGYGGIKGYTVAYNCAGDIRCIGSDCVDPSYEANTDFSSAASAMEVLNQYRFDSAGNSIFPGEPEECQASPNNCCKKAGGGVDIGDYVNAARSVASLYSFLSGGATATWTAYANAFTYFLSSGQTGTLSGLLGNTISNALGTTTSVIYTSPGIVSYETAHAMGLTVTTEGITEVTMVSAELISTLATVATVITIALTVYSILKFAYDYMFQCSRDDVITSSKLQLRLCHLVGVKKIKKAFGLFTKKINVYCCFNSILARIIHEQGRPQLGIGWGNAYLPNCRGFTPEELASIDFSRIDLREYMQYIEYKTEISPEEVEEIKRKFFQQP